MAERPLYTLYKNLKAQNYDVPDDYNKFESALTRDGKGGADNRHAIYENLKAQNFDVPSTYERFYSALFEPRSKTSSRAKGGSVPMSAADRARFSAGAAAISASAQQTMNNAGKYNRLKQRKQKQQKNFGRVNLGIHQTPFGGDANNVVKDDFAYNPETGKAGTYVTSDNENAYTQNDAEQKQAILDQQNNAYQQAVDTGEIPSALDVRDMNGNYDLQENIGKNGTYLTEEGAQKQFDNKLADAYARKKEIEAAIAEDHRLHGNPLLSYGASIGGSNGRTAEQNDYSNKLATSLALVNQQIGALEAVKQYPTSSWGEDALKALDNTAFTAKTWDFGLTDFATMGQMERIKTKMDNNIPLSGSDKMLLKSKLGADAAAALEDEKMGNIYRWTKIAGQSLPFMADFFLTGGYGGITKGISRGALKIAAKRGMGKVSAAILKNTGIVAGDVIGSYAMAGTEQALKTGADIMQRHLGNLYQDEKGDYKFGTFDESGNLLHEGGESMGTALYKGLTSAMVENYTEKLFGHNYGIKKGAIAAMEKHGMNGTAQFFKNIGKSGWYTNSKKWMEKFGINGFGEEVMEEEIGIPLHALLDGDNKFSDLGDAKQQLDIIGGMAISVGSMYAMGAGSRPVKGVYNRAQYYRFRNKVNVADSDAQNLLGDNWADIKDKIDNATNEQMGSVLAGILRQRDTMTKEQINAAVNYGVNLMKMRGYNIAKTAEMNAREITNEPTTPEEQHQTDIDNAYSEGHDADDADKHDIQIQQEDQMKTLAAALGISEQQLSAMSDEELESLTGQNDKLDQAIYDYQLSSARYQGVVDDAQDKVDLAAHQAEQRVDMYTDQSRGSVRNATIKASGGLEDYGVYIISGNIATHDDGSIDVSNSDDMILYYDPTTNSVEHADALMFAELGEELPADDVKAKAVADAKENAIKEVAGIIDGTVEVGSQFNVTDTDGTEHTYEVLADYGDGTAAISIDGNVVENPYSLADLQQMKDLEDQKRLEAAKAEREQIEKERAEQQTQETEQTEETQPSFDFNQILNDNGNVVLVDVLDKDGNTKYPDSRLFLIRDTGAKAKVVELKSDGTIVPHAVNKEDVATISSMSLDEYKQAMPESSMIEDNSGENRGEIEVETPKIEGETAAPESAENTETAVPAETPATEQTPAAPAIALEDGTIVPMLEDGNPDFSKLTAAQTAELYDSQFGEDADSIVSGYVSDAKKALDKASNMTVKGKTFVEQKAAKDAKEKAIADAQAAYDSAIAIRDAYNERQLAKVEDTAEGRKNLIDKARRKFVRLKSAVKDDAEAVAQIYKETVGTLLHRLYDGTGIDVTDTIPLTAEEYVASNLGAHSLNYEGTETSKGVKQETGLSREDFAKTQLLAADGKGTTIDALVHSLWENRPSNLDSLDTQDIRNALLSIITSGFKASESRNYIENLRIAQAENILEEQKKAADNAVFADEQKAKQEEEEKKAEENAEEKAEEKTHSESFNKIVDLAKNLEEILDNPDNVKEIDKITHEIDELLETLSDEEFKEVSDALLNIDEDLEYLTADEYERREGVEESKKAKAYNESLQQAIKRIAPYADALKAAVKSGDKKAIAKAQKELTDALLASNLGHGYLSGQLEYAKSAKKKDESYSERRALVKPLTDAINAIESALDSALAEAGLEGVHVDFTEGGHGWIYADKGSAWSSRLKALDNDYRNVSQYETQNPISVLPQVAMDNVEKVAGIIKSRIEEGERYNSDEYNDEENEKINEQTNENINAPEVPEDATEENPLGAQLDQTDLPFSARDNGTQQTTAERAADVEKNKVDDMKVVDNIVGEKTRKAFERLAKMMGANIQWQYSDKLGNGWIQETTDADGNVHRTIFITLDSSITEGAQFIFGHEMTHQIKHLNPAAYNELTQLVLDTYGSDAFDKAVDETMQRYSNAGFSGRARDYYAEEVVADTVGEMIRDLNLAHTLAMKMSHPLLAAIHEILQKIKLAFFGTEYSDVTKNIIRSIEQAYVKTANGEVTNFETGEDVSFSLRQKPEPKKKGIGYKVFVLKDGKLYPPMVANPDGAATPVGVWLDADAAPIAGESKTGRPQVKQGGKGTQGGSGKLAYRPGWHLGVVPYAIQFNRKDADGNKTLFPKNFVFAEVEYAADVDYQEEARQEGINPSGKYQHSLAGLKHLPTDGYYMYRTNPNPETDPWVITGAMKVNRILTRAEQAELVKNAGREPQQIQEGDIVTDDVVNSINQEIAAAPKFSLKVYHGSGADFTEFDFDHMCEGAGSQVFGWGGYVTSSKKIGKSYATLMDNDPSMAYYRIQHSNGTRFAKKYPTLESFLHGDKKIAMNDKFTEQEKIDYYNEMKKLAEPYHNLYEVDIPEDNGSNYLDWDKPLSKEQQNAIREGLEHIGVDIKKLESKGQSLERTGENVYNSTLYIGLTGTEYDLPERTKGISKFLSSVGFTGIKYKAGRNFGGAKKGDTNYVIFKPEDMRITEHTKFSIKTYHGSQASFDKFDHSFMGSGEGAQAYGWGTYVSEVEGIAKAYAKANAKKNAPSRLMYQGKPMTYKTPTIIYQVALDMDKFNISAKEAISKMIDANEKKLASVGDTPFAKMRAKQVQDELKVLKDLNPSDFKINEDYDTVAQDLIDTKSGLDLLEDELKDAKSYVDLYQSRLDEAKEELSKAKESGTGLGVDMYESDIEYYSKQVERYKQSIKTKESDIKDVKTKVAALQKKLDSMEKPRNLYSVDIPDDTGRNYIGWDEPLGAAKIMRLPKVFKANGWEYKKVGMYDTYKIDGNEHEVWLEPSLTTGKELYRDLTNALGSDKAASEFLSKAGFVGVKVIAQRNTGGNKEGKMNYVIFDENNAQITSHTKFSLKDPFKMSDNEKKERGDRLIKAPAIDVASGVIQKTPELSARKAAEKWWNENVEQPLVFNTEVGDVVIDEKSIKDSLAHRYNQAKLDSITSLPAGFGNSVYIGTISDFVRTRDNVQNHYFAYPINYDGQRNYVFCRAMQDTNKNRLYVHEVFVADKINEGNTLQTAASKPHGGIALYKEILANVLSAAKIDNSSETAKKNGEKVEVEEPKTFDEFLNHPSLKFSIKNEEQRKAAEDAYEYASKLRPNKYAQYALVDMSNPSNSPEYYEKKVLADRWRRFYNKAVHNELDDVYKDAWGNYKLFDLDRPFADQVNEVKGDVPSEFNAPDVTANKNADNESGAEYHEYKQGGLPSVTYEDRYKAFKQREANRKKVAGLKKEQKETEDSYNSKGKERAEYHKQLMKEYMDKHKMTEEYEIPDDVWDDLRSKSFEKYQDELDSLFNKYKDLDRQIKAVAEPRFSLKDEKTLAGVHNITEEKLLKAIKQGGLANPSVAVIDSSNQNHEDYGDISLILPSDKVAKRTGKNAGTWQGDAWTPTYPQVERQMSNKGAEKASNDVSSVPSDMYSEVRRGLDRWLDGGESNSAMAYMFLHEKGVAPEPKMIQPKFSDEAYNELKSITAGDFNIYGISKADAQKVLDMYIEAKFDGDKALYEEKTKVWLERNKAIVDAGTKGGMRYAIAKENVELYGEYGFNYKGVQSFVRDVEYDHRKTGVDINATLNEVEDYIKTNNLTDEFNTWLEGKEKEYGIKEVIFDGFTPSGNRKYVPNTLENVSKIMKKQGRNGATGTSVSFQNFAARLMPSYGTLKDIRSKKNLLTSDHEDLDKFNEKWANVFFDLGMKCQPDATGTFDDYGLARLSEAAMTSDPQAYLKKEYNVDFSDVDTKRLKEMVKAIKEEYPAMYFETKFERPVGFDEFSSAVVPTTASNEVKQALQNAGVQIYEYDKEKEGDRSRAFNEAINSSDNIRFSLKSMMAKPEGWKQANKKAIRIAEAIERDPKFSLKNLDGTLIKAGTYFSGGGLVEEGLKGIIDPVVAVEYDEKISGVYRNNFGQHIVTADVRDVDPRELVKQIDGEVEYFHASPVCKNYSQAKSNHAEVELDKETAASTADFINAVKPKVVTIENVKGYKDSDAMKTITDALDANGYTWDADVYNAADYGGYTNRERLIVRAVRDGKLPEKPKKMAHKNGWYEAVADIIQTLTEKKNGVAPWMDIRLKADGIDWRNIDKPLYVMGSAYADGKVPHAFADELLPTLRTKSGDVIVMPDGKVYRAMGRVLARVSGVSDDYKMPFSENLSHTIIGNGIPTQLTEHVIAPLLTGSDPKFSIRTYHGTGASFDKFDFSHMGEGEGSQAFGWGGYVTNSKEIAEDYTRRAKIRKDNGGFEFVTDMSANNKDMVRQYIYKHKDVDKGLDAMRKDLSSAIEMFPDDEDLKELSNILAKKNEEIAVPDNIAYLYDVDIPDDNGDYLDWDAPLTDKQKNTIIKALRRLKINFADFEKRGFSFDGSFGGNAYDFLMYALRSTKKWEDVNASRAVSKFLSSIGFKGIKYKAGTIFGGAKEGDYNYVIFDENNANIVGNTRFSLRYDKFEHDLNQWKKDNNLPKDAQRPTIPQRNAGESAVDFLKRVDEYRKQMALWKTAPTYEQHLLSDDTALGELNRELQRGSVLKRIAFQDSMLAIRKAQEAIMKEVGVDRLNMAEDAYTAENRSHGKGKNEFEEYNNEFLQPLRKAYHQMKKVLGDSYDNVRIYMMAKHGLERDAQMAFKKSLEADYEDVAQRSAAYKAYKGDINRIINDSDLEFGRVDFTTWRQRDNALRAKYSPSYMDYRYDKNGIAYDYSGLSALFGGSDFEEAAHKLVRDIESSHVAEVQDLWNATNAATKKILRDGYKAGMMSKDTYQYVRDMYSHYIPLRGWDGTTADQVWDYIGGGKGAFNQTLKTAHGRTSIADDPIAYIENMAESGILLNNKNWVKQHLMLLAQNHPTSLLTLSKAWYVKSTDANGNEEWIPATPQITSQMNSNQVKAAIDAFEQKMENMAQTGDATQKRDGLNIAYPQTHSEEREHEVRVMKDGEEYVIYVNGDPQLAQAMNNTRAHRVREIQSGKLDRAAAWLGRKMAAAYTSLSPLFIPSNYFRDLTMTLASTAIREDAKYNYLLRKNLATSWNLGFMLRDYQNGKLREKVSNGNATPKEQMFYDFMMNGGETGFVSSLDVEDLKKKFKNDLKDLDRWKANPVKVGHTIMDGIEFLNRAIEDSNRFAVYMTSIQYGRSIDEAVNDAKDVTLNFNRKGTGEYGWQMIRNLYLFINPAVQSLQTLGALAKHHPFKFTAVTASWLASGVLVPIVNAALMNLLGGDDDKDKYWQFTKWDRRNNLIMWVPFTHEYVKIPLAQEFRAFYGVGDMIASKMMGGELAEESWSQYCEDLLGQVVDMLPLDPTGYDGNIAVSLMPNAIRPVFELAFNVDFTGKPLFKETEYNKYDPNFTKAYVGTPDWLVRASRMVNSIGNDYPDVQQNSIDAFGDPRYNLNNPAVVDHVLSSYLGGAYTMGSQVLGVLTKSLNDPKEIKVADIPLFSKFVRNPDDRPVTKKQGDEFWDMKENHDRAANTLSKLKKQAKVDGDYSMLERFYGSEEYKQYKQDDVKVKKYEEDKKKERAEESGEEYRPHKLNAEDIYKAHATPKDDFEDLKLKQLYTKLNGFKSAYDLLVDTAPSQSDSYYNTNKTAIDAIDEISLDKQEIYELKKGFLDDGKDAYNAEDMKRIRELRKNILAVLEKANKVVVANQKAKAEK